MDLRKKLFYLRQNWLSFNQNSSPLQRRKKDSQRLGRKSYELLEMFFARVARYFIGRVSLR
jgi:hypothetical protein